MTRVLSIAAGAMAMFAAATSANAAAVVQAPVGPIPSSVTNPGSFVLGHNLSGGPGSFSDSFNFTILGSVPAYFNGQVSSIEGPSSGEQNINFSGPDLTVDGAQVFTKTSSDSHPETWAILSPIVLAPNVSHTITVAGTLNGSSGGSYSGSFNVTPAVPEPATWAMMLLGFGAMGLSLRHRRNPALAQIA